jgi:DNA-binding transcriptional LysR family regulator
MNLLHLEYFYTVAKEGGFLRASEKLRIQQPAISRMVGQLEDYFGFKLFERLGRNVRLTEKGQQVFESCKNIFGEVDELKMSLGKISGEAKGPLNIASAEAISSHLLPLILPKLLSERPKLHPNIFSGPASMLLKKIEDGDMELGLFFHVPELSEKVVIEKSIELPFHLVVRKDLKKDSKTLSSFIGSREIDDISTRRFPTVDRLREKYPDVKIRISSNNLTAHKEMVLQGLGVAILPEFLIHKELKNKELVEALPGEKFAFKLKVVRRKNAVLSLGASQLLEAVSIYLAR